MQTTETPQAASEGDTRRSEHEVIDHPSRSEANPEGSAAAHESPPGTGKNESPTLLQAVAHYWRMSVLIVLASTALSAAVGVYLTPPAEATATIALKTPPSNNVLSPGAQGDASLARYTAQRARFVTSDTVMAEVGNLLGTDDISALRSQVDAVPSGDSNVVTIKAEAETPEEAVELADAVATAYGTETAEQVRRLTESAIASIEESAAGVRESIEVGAGSSAVNTSAASTLAELELQASEIKTNSALLGDGVEFIIAPRLETVVSPGFPVRETGLGFLVGLVIAATLSWLRADREAAARRAG